MHCLVQEFVYVYLGYCHFYREEKIKKVLLIMAKRKNTGTINSYTFATVPNLEIAMDGDIFIAIK